MKYNKECDRWVSKDGLVYRYDKKTDRLVLCKLQNRNGYLGVYNTIDGKYVLVHRLVWETFNSHIPKDMEIDHIDTDKHNNKLDNLRCVSHKENINNPLTKSKMSKSASERKMTMVFKRKPHSIFGMKFFEHFGLHKTDNIHLYSIEYSYYKNHNKVCSWE